jgi:SSS family solute:Na+ symporter
VKDIYQAYINPAASEKQLMRHSRWASVLVVIAGLLFSLVIRNINEIWGWITMSIGAGLIIPQLVRWYWWRLNGYGFASGMIFGMVAAVIQKIVFPYWPEYFSFIFAAGASFVAMLIGTYMTEPTELNVLWEFYRRTRPFGLWRPVRRKMPAKIMAKINAENKRDLVSLVMAVPWQVVLFLTMMMIVMGRWDSFAVLLVILAVLSVGLYFTWFRHLSAEVKVDE